MTEDQFIDTIFQKEGDTYGDQTTHPPIDQPTARGGITLPALQEYYQATGLGTPTVDDLKTITHVKAREVVRWQMRRLAQRSQLSTIVYEPLRLQMLDFAYNSGESLAIRWLQRVLRVMRTGEMDDATQHAVNTQDPWLVNQALVAARLEMIDRWTDQNAQAKAWEEGLESRGLTFSQLEVP